MIVYVPLDHWCEALCVVTTAYVLVLYVAGLLVTWREAYKQRPPTASDHPEYDAKASDALLCGMFWPFLMLMHFVQRISR